MAQSTLTLRRARASTAWGVPLALGAFAVVEGPGCGASLDADHGRGVEDALELPVVRLGVDAGFLCDSPSRGGWAQVRRSRRGDRRRRIRIGSRRRRPGTGR